MSFRPPLERRPYLLEELSKCAIEAAHCRPHRYETVVDGSEDRGCVDC